MKILVLNLGSSSIKYQVLELPAATILATGIVEKIGEPTSRLVHRVRKATGELDESVRADPIPDHRDGLRRAFRALSDSSATGLDAIGHRVVHGADVFHEPAMIDTKVVEAIRALNSLAPLHNPANVMGIELALELCPGVPQIAVFDTAFHQSIPPHAFHYAVPRDWYTSHHVRRYGFHGTSHHYVAKEAATYLGRPLETLNLISLHLGNGASATAIEGGRSVDTSMGMTPLEGLIMGTRCEDLDPAIPFYLERETGTKPDQLESILNQQSGMKGICGVNDMREVIRLAEAGDKNAELALAMYCYRIRKYIGAYSAVLGRVDALIFTGGVGENSPSVRARCSEGLGNLGILLDQEKNQKARKLITEIQSDDARIKVLVIPTNEELEVARQTLACIQKGSTL